MTARERAQRPTVVRRTVRVEYIESNAFRVVHADGARVGVRADKRSLHMSVYSERPRTPDYEDYLPARGRPATLVRRDPRSTLVREVEVELILDLEAARRLRAALELELEAAERCDA